MFGTNPTACRLTVDGLALIGTTASTIRGLRFHTGDPANPPSQNQPPATDPATPPTPPPATDPATPPPGTPPAATPPAPNPDPLTQPVGGVPFDQLPKETQSEVKRLRQNEIRIKSELATGISDERRKELGKLLGYEKDETPDPAALTTAVGELTATRDTLTSENSDLKRANMVLLTAPDANANAALLLDSKGFTESIKGLDPTDTAAIKTAIETWVKDHPAHAATPLRPGLPGSSGPRQQGEPRTPGKTSLEGAIGTAMSSPK